MKTMVKAQKSKIEIMNQLQPCVRPHTVKRATKQKTASANSCNLFVSIL